MMASLSEQGREAYYNEHDLLSNPFNELRAYDKWRQWRSGWLAAQRDDPLATGTDGLEFETGFEDDGN